MDPLKPTKHRASRLGTTNQASTQPTRRTTRSSTGTTRIPVFIDEPAKATVAELTKSGEKRKLDSDKSEPSGGDGKRKKENHASRFPNGAPKGGRIGKGKGKQPAVAPIQNVKASEGVVATQESGNRSLSNGAGPSRAGKGSQTDVQAVLEMMNTDYTAARRNGAKKPSLMDPVYYHTTKHSIPSQVQSGQNFVIRLSILQNSSARLRSMSLILLEPFLRQDLANHPWLREATPNLESLTIRGARSGSDMWADDTKNIFTTAPFGGAAPRLKSIDISAFYLPTATFSDLTSIALSKIRFHKVEAIADVVHLLERSPRLVSFALKNITLPATFIKDLQSSKIVLFGLERLTLEFVETPFVKYILNRICAPAYLRIRVKVNASEGDTLESIMPPGFVKSPSAVALQYAKINLSKLSSAGMAISVEAHDSKFDNTEDASLVVVIAGGKNLLKRTFATLDHILPKSLAVLELQSLKLHSRSSFISTPGFISGLAHFHSLRELVLISCDHRPLDALAMAQGICPSIRRLRVERELGEEALEQVLLARRGSALDCVEIAYCHSIRGSTVLRWMDLVTKVHLRDVDVEDDLV
ncbi:hypothetical protein BOTBODRAFT_476873 [Botryobasidium botryosum FD-172 SS1]|uniref:Uncharacterized protein n=1 Tax=Botryobasidium botryosum (strain FD-172 SS1) TaxID=930990 RepID=A0A067N406_BOTB1|nr:hypothetical protein BOTBODRAFT_476873 [Botryobasidium botryosum FD-172 SS1]